MPNIIEIQPETPLGNSLDEMNQNFHLMNIRICKLQEDIRRWTGMYDSLMSIKDRLNDNTKTMDRVSQRYTDASNIVYNAQQYWQLPITIMYAPGFSVLGNFNEVRLWLLDHFSPSDFIDNQLIRVTFLIKNYDPESLDQYPIGELSNTAMDSIASSYNVSSRAILDYLSILNQLRQTISSMNSIFIRAKKLNFEIVESEQVHLLYDSIKYINGQFTSTLVPDLTEHDIQLLHCFADQYVNVFEPALPLYSNIVENFPAELLPRFDNFLIYSNFGHHFNFIKTNNSWEYYPNDLVPHGQGFNCNSCFSIIDTQKIYTNDDCGFRASFELIECSLPNSSYGEPLIPTPE